MQQCALTIIQNKNNDNDKNNDYKMQQCALSIMIKTLIIIKTMIIKCNNVH